MRDVVYIVGNLLGSSIKKRDIALYVVLCLLYYLCGTYYLLYMYDAGDLTKKRLLVTALEISINIVVLVVSFIKIFLNIKPKKKLLFISSFIALHSILNVMIWVIFFIVIFTYTLALEPILKEYTYSYVSNINDIIASLMFFISNIFYYKLMRKYFSSTNYRLKQ
jgi:hypothetical protein